MHSINGRYSSQSLQEDALNLWMINGAFELARDDSILEKQNTCPCVRAL